MEQSRGWSRALPIHLGVVAIEKGAFGSPLTKVVNLYINNIYKKQISVYFDNLVAFKTIIFILQKICPVIRYNDNIM